MQQLIDLLWQTLVNPNVVYVLLIAGLWAVVLAFVTPGTGIAEAAAVVFLGLAFVGMTRLPVNFVGLAFVLLSILLFALELKFPSHGAFLVAGMLTLGGGSIFLFRSEVSFGVSLWTVGATVIATAAFFSFALTKAWAMRKAPPVQNPDAVIGAIGEAKTDIFAEGTVQVGNELWTAQADELIPAGTKVKIVKRSGLRLKVARNGSGARA
jgi:membrane-bound serine protease (ClpP class)